jgi:hypothetical protein
LPAILERLWVAGAVHNALDLMQPFYAVDSALFCCLLSVRRWK